MLAHRLPTVRTVEAYLRREFRSHGSTRFEEIWPDWQWDQAKYIVTDLVGEAQIRSMGVAGALNDNGGGRSGLAHQFVSVRG